MYITIQRKPKKVTSIKDLWDLKFDEATSKITVSDEAYDRLNLKENNFILAANPENNKDVALQISAEVTDDSFYVTQAGAKRAKNKSFKDTILAEFLTNIGGTEFTLVHTYDNYYKIYGAVEINNDTDNLNLVSALISAEDNGTLVEVPVVEEAVAETIDSSPF